MGVENCYRGIDEYAARIIKCKASQLVGKVGFNESDREDLEQEMVLDLLGRLPKFNRERSRLHTFITRVVDHKVATIIEAREAGKRNYRLCTCSLNDSLGDREGNTTERGESIDQEDYFHRMGWLSSPAAESRDLAIDVRRVLAGLPRDLRELCKHLQVKSITEVSRETGIPRGTIYDLRRKVRAILEESGLKDYL